MVLRRTLLAILVVLIVFSLTITDNASTEDVDVMLQEPIEEVGTTEPSTELETQPSKEVETTESTTVPETQPIEEIETTAPETQPTEVVEQPTQWQGEVLNARNGVVQGPSGKETYYNLPMDGVIKIMRNLGYSEEEYPYWIRDDGVKMFGPYVMCAANLELRPRGTIIETSLGTAIVCDTGSFAEKNPTQLDIAVDW